MRHIAAGCRQLTHLEELRAPMSEILDGLAAQLAELERYKAKFGPIENYEEEEEQGEEDDDEEASDSDTA